VAHLAPHLEELDISNNELDSSTLSTIFHTLSRQPPPTAGAARPPPPGQTHGAQSRGAVDDRMGAMGVGGWGEGGEGEEEVGGVEGGGGGGAGERAGERACAAAQSMLGVLNVSQLYETGGGAGPGLVGSLYPELPLEPLLGLIHSSPIRTLRLGGWYISPPALASLCHALGPPTLVWGGGLKPIPTRGGIGWGGSFPGASSWSLCEGLEAGDCLEVLELGVTSVGDWANLARLILPRDASPLLLLPPAHHPLPHATASPILPLQHPLLQPLLQLATTRHYTCAYTLANPAAALRHAGAAVCREEGGGDGGGDAVRGGGGAALEEGVAVVAPGDGIGVTVEGAGAGAGGERARGEGGRKKSRLGKRERLKLRDLRVFSSSYDLHVSSSSYDMNVSSSSYDLRGSWSSSSHVALHAPACSGSSIAREGLNEAGWGSGAVGGGGVCTDAVGISGGGGLRLKTLVVRGSQSHRDVHDGGRTGGGGEGGGEGGGRGGAKYQKKCRAELDENLEMFFRYEILKSTLYIDFYIVIALGH
jgi:hypothetical protein